MIVSAIHQHELAMSIHVSPPSWTPLPPCSPLYPLGCPRALALGALLHASNLHWSSILHMIIYMFQCYSLKSYLPHPLPLNPKVCSLHLCLLSYPACRIIVTVFLNSTYMCQYTVFVSFWLTSLCKIGSSFIHLIRTALNVFLLIAE